MKIGRLFTALALSLAPLSLVAQESGVEVDYSHPVKYKVGGIKVEGNTFYSDQQIISLTGIQKGMEVTVPGEALSNVVERLWLQRYFEDVSLTIDSLNVAGDSAWFSIRIKERPRVSRWSFSGVTSGERKDIQERVNLRPGREFSEYVEKTTSDIIKRDFAEKGFLLCEVTAETVKDSIIRNAIYFDRKTTLAEDVEFVPSPLSPDILDCHFRISGQEMLACRCGMVGARLIGNLVKEGKCRTYHQSCDCARHEISS